MLNLYKELITEYGYYRKDFRTHSHNELKRIYPIVDRIEALAPAMEAVR